jgi:hypothetical protein
MHDNRKRLKESAFSKADIFWELVAPFCGVTFVSLDRAVVWVHTRELYVLTEIVTSILAKETGTARDARLDRHAIAFIVSDVVAHLDNYNGSQEPNP